MNNLSDAAERTVALPFTWNQGWVLLAVASIIAAAGLIGGYAAFLAEDRRLVADEGDGAPRRLRFLILGVVAAACVPLFLSLVRSDVINVIISDRNGGRLESLLVFIGLCLIAAFSARAFIDSLTKQALQRLTVKVDRAEAKAETAREVASGAIAEMEALDGGGAEIDPVDGAEAHAEAAPLPAEGVPPVDELEWRVLRALTKSPLRTATGTAADAGIPTSRIGELLASLADKGLAAATRSARSGGVRWKITPAGIAALQAPR